MLPPLWRRLRVADRDPDRGKRVGGRTRCLAADQLEYLEGCEEVALCFFLSRAMSDLRFSSAPFDSTIERLICHSQAQTP